MQPCIKRRLLYAASQAYEPELETVKRAVGWLARPIVVARDVEYWRQPIDLALVGRVPEGVVVAFRGTLPPFGCRGGQCVTMVLDWLNDGLTVCRTDPAYGGGVHMGFAESMRRLWRDAADGGLGVHAAIQAQFDRGAPRRLFFTGHSKGGALANLAAYRAAHEPRWRDAEIGVLTLAAARAGNGAFARAYARERIRCERYELAFDPVPHLPPGPQTPSWVRRLIQQFWPSMAAGDYHPVGVRVPGQGEKLYWLDEWIAHAGAVLRRKGLDIDSVVPAVIAAHSLGPLSGYDRLICAGGADCTHRLPQRLAA